MSSISPSSSASQASAVDCTTAVVGVDLKGCMDSVAVMVASGGLTPAQASAAVKQVVSAYHAYLRKVGSSSESVSSQCSSCSNVESVLSSDVASSSVVSVSRVKDQCSKPRREIGMPWRRASSAIVPGRCYRAILREGVVDKLPVYPSFSDLLRLPSDDVVSNCDLQALGLTKSQGVAHVAPLVSGGVVLLDVLKSQAAWSNPAADSKSLWSRLTGASVSRDLMTDFRPSMSVGAESSVSGIRFHNELDEWLYTVLGECWHSIEPSQLDIVSSSAAMLQEVDKRKLRMYEACGDAKLTCLLANLAADMDQHVSVYQNMRSSKFSNTALSRAFVSKVPRAAVSFVAGVDARVGATGAAALEAIVGLVSRTLSQRAVAKLVIALELLPDDWNEALTLCMSSM